MSSPRARISAARSDVGKVRSLNEDAFVDRPADGLWAVADGMGGLSRGDRASGMLKQALETIELDGSLAPNIERLKHCIEAVNEQLVADRTGGMSGSTVVALLVQGGDFACIWAGDSRLYRLRGKVLDRLTKDHSLVEELVASGAITAQAARKHPLANRITRAIGTNGQLELDAIDGRIAKGDRLLLSTDGLHGFVEPEEIARLAGAEDLDAATAGLIGAALDAGGRDNITVVLIEALS